MIPVVLRVRSFVIRSLILFWFIVESIHILLNEFDVETVGTSCMNLKESGSVETHLYMNATRDLFLCHRCMST